MAGIMTNSEKVVGGRFGQGGRLRQVPLQQHWSMYLVCWEAIGQ